MKKRLLCSTLLIVFTESLVLSILFLPVSSEVTFVSSEVWVARASTPQAGGYGQAAVGTTDYIYVVRCLYASSAPGFWCYDPNGNIWTSLSTSNLPVGAFRNGTALAWDYSRFIYALGGARYEDSDRRLFFRYDISTSSWTQLADTPGPQGAGDAMTWSGYDNHIYTFLGSNTHGTIFARYDSSANTWEVKSPPPAGTDDGCSVVWAGGRYLFALRGEYLDTSPLTDFWRYDVATDEWTSIAQIPKEGGVGDGASLLWVGFWLPEQADYIYALGGGDCWENSGSDFYRYSISTNGWERLTDIPYPVGYYNGNRLGLAAGRVYYWQGTPSTWSGGGNTFCSYSLIEAANSAPTLTSGSVSPASGSSDVTFAYEVTYTDTDGDAPSYVKVCIDENSFAMSKVSGTYTGGALYRYTASSLGTGSHTYYFEASDGTDTTQLPTSGSYSGPTVTEELYVCTTTLTISPPNFALQVSNSVTLTVTLKDENNSSLTGKTITWSKTAGSLSATSGVTDSAGQVSVTYIAPSYETTVTVTASFAGDTQYGASSENSLGTVTSPVDTDSDGMPDTWENQYGLNPNTNDAAQDKDGDGYTNLQEYQAGTNPSLASSYPGSPVSENVPEGEGAPSAGGIPITYVAVGAVAVIVVVLALVFYTRFR